MNQQRALDLGKKFLGMCFKTEADQSIEKNEMILKLVVLDAVYSVNIPLDLATEAALSKAWTSLFSSLLAKLNYEVEHATVQKQQDHGTNDDSKEPEQN